MKKGFGIGLLMAILSLSLEGCVDNAMQDVSQVKNLKEVNFSLFQTSVEALPSRADDAVGTPLAETKLFSELEVAMFPVESPTTVPYTIRQNKDDVNFGKTKMYVPAGDYYLVAVAANTASPTANKHININSNAEVVFPKNVVTDMAYIHKKVSIGNKEKNEINLSLNRAVSVFFLKAIDQIPTTVKSVKLTLSNGVGKVFNPSKGVCSQPEPIVNTYDVTDGRGKTPSFTVYTLLSATPDVNDVKATIEIFDDDGKPVKTFTLDNIHLELGKKTTYRGPVFTKATEASFTISQATIEDGEDHTFE